MKFAATPFNTPNTRWPNGLHSGKTGSSDGVALPNGVVRRRNETCDQESRDAILLESDEFRVHQLASLLSNSGWSVQIAGTIESAAKLVRAGEGKLLLTSLAGEAPPRACNLDLFALCRERGLIIVVYADGFGRWPLASRCEILLAGASALLDSARKSFGTELQNELEQLMVSEQRREEEERRIRETMARIGVIGQSAAMLSVFRCVLRIGTESDVPTLITGESGTGKESLAKAIYHLDPKRANKPFIKFNSAALSAALAESDLFGHVRGAFTGAARERKGLFRAADGGILFFDEIGELDISVQAKLLRVLQEQRVRPVGSEHEFPVDVRILAATNRDLQEMIRKGTFRLDLYHRLKGATVHLPPLRERPNDIAELVQFFMKKHRASTDVAIAGIEADCLEAICRLKLPGNVRELEPLIRTAVRSKTAPGPLRLSDLPPELWEELREGNLPAHSPERTETGPRTLTPSEPGGHEHQVADTHSESQWGVMLEEHGGLPGCEEWLERSLVSYALERARNNRTKCANLLRVSTRTLRNKKRKHGL